MEWVLVLFFYAELPAPTSETFRPMAVHGYASRQQCEADGRAGVDAMQWSRRQVRFFCVKRAL